MNNKNNQNSQTAGTKTTKPSSPFQPLKKISVTEGYHGNPVTNNTQSNQKQGK